jgi:unsaturated rhamnogalacturonyl hydrolase
MLTTAPLKYLLKSNSHFLRTGLQTLLVFLLLSLSSISAQTTFTKNSKEVVALMKAVNDQWQINNTYKNNSFWHHAAYHSGNMEAYRITGKEEYRAYSEKWAEYNGWKGAASNDTANWKYTYGETDSFVLFGDWQICFQTYIDLYKIDPLKNPDKIARARAVMEYEMSTPRNDYWWWADGLYMVMPVMTKMYQITQNPLYLTKLKEYFEFADSLMYDPECSLYYRDAKYVYPLEPTVNGIKNFWSRGNGWVFAAFAKVLTDLPADDKLVRPLLTKRFKSMAKALKNSQMTEGYWTRSILDPAHAPGYETSGTAFFCYGLLWGINHGLLKEKEYLPTAIKSWNYLQNIAVQPDFSVAYVQPIGENASPNTNVKETSKADFGVGAFLHAAAETSCYLARHPNKVKRH